MLGVIVMLISYNAGRDLRLGHQYHWYVRLSQRITEFVFTLATNTAMLNAVTYAQVLS